MVPPSECYYNTLLCCDYFASSSVVSRTFSALCMYRSSSIILTLGYICANFVSFAASIAELAHGEKSRTKSLNHSPTLYDAPGTKALALLNKQDCWWRPPWMCVFSYTRIFNFLSSWPRPSPDDDGVLIWPRYSEDVVAHQKWIF